MKEKGERENHLVAWITSICMLVAMVICNICDNTTGGAGDWSMIVMVALLYAWITVFPILFFMGKRGVLVSLLAASVVTLPFLKLLSSILDVSAVYTIGKPMALIGIVYLALVFAVFLICKKQVFTSLGISFLLAIPAMVVINIFLSHLIQEPIFDLWDILTAVILVVLAVVAFCVNAALRKKRNS